MAGRAFGHRRTTPRTDKQVFLTVRKTIDCVIATFCIEEGVALLYSDREFEPFVRHLGLQEPAPEL